MLHKTFNVTHDFLNTYVQKNVMFRFPFYIFSPIDGGPPKVDCSLPFLSQTQLNPKSNSIQHLWWVFVITTALLLITLLKAVNR